MVSQHRIKQCRGEKKHGNGWEDILCKCSVCRALKIQHAMLAYSGQGQCFKEPQSPLYLHKSRGWVGDRSHTTCMNDLVIGSFGAIFSPQPFFKFARRIKRYISSPIVDWHWKRKCVKYTWIKEKVAVSLEKIVG